MAFLEKSGTSNIEREWLEQTAPDKNRLEATYEFRNKQLFLALCGVADADVSELEKLLDVELIPRGHAFQIRAESQERFGRAIRFFEMMEERFQAGEGHYPERFDREYIFKRVIEESGGEIISPATRRYEDLLNERVVTTHRGKPIFPKTVNQARFVESLLFNPITISRGPAGTGKTFLAVAVACRFLLSGEVDRIILTRPAVEAGESLGFLPGDLSQKVDPYLRPLYDALYECLGVEKVAEYVATQKIEVAPLAYMRGRTLNHSFVILDEAQNCTLAQLKMFLTRLGRNTRMGIGGDVTQIDLIPGKSGLMEAIRILKEVAGVSVVELGREDIIRNPIVERIVHAFETAEDGKK